jgi:hypothetical protein
VVDWRAVDFGLRSTLTARKGRRGFWGAPGALALLSAAALLAVVWVVGQPHRAEISLEAALGASADPAPRMGSILHAGATLSTDEAGSARVRLPDGSRAAFGARTRARFARASRDEIEIRLLTGAVAVDAAHVQRSQFVVDAGSVRVHVVGTAFRVERQPEQVTVAVARGRVRIESEAQPPRFVEAGERRVTGVGGALIAEGRLTPGDTEAFAPLGLPLERPLEVSAGGGPATDAVQPAPAPPAPKRKQVPTRRRGVEPAPSPKDPALAPSPRTVPRSALAGSMALTGSEDSPASPPTPLPDPPERTGNSGFPFTAEGPFLQQAMESLEDGTCPRYLPGLGEVAEWSPDRSAREAARIFRARCFDIQRVHLRAKLEYRRYLEQHPFGRFAAEAARALER